MAKTKAGSPAKTTKRGPLSVKEKDVIRRLAGNSTPEQIALKLNRSVDTVVGFVESLMQAPPKAKKSPLGEELKKRPEWHNFQQQFTEEELEFFIYRYVQLMDQFGRDDVLPTEEMQIFTLITYEILINRNLHEQGINNALILELNTKISTLKEESLTDDYDSDLLMELNIQFDNARAGQKSASDRLKDLTVKQTATLKELKATRDQRVKVNENPSNSFLGLLKQLNDVRMAEKMGREAEMMRLVAEKERIRLSQPHRYEDGVVDQPILTSDTLIDDYEEATKALPGPDPESELPGPTLQEMEE